MVLKEALRVEGHVAPLAPVLGPLLAGLADSCDDWVGGQDDQVTAVVKPDSCLSTPGVGPGPHNLLPIPSMLLHGELHHLASKLEQGDLLLLLLLVSAGLLLLLTLLHRLDDG